MSSKGQNWQNFKPRLSIFEKLPTKVFMKGKELPAYSRVLPHQHDWDQLIYALDGVLEVQSDTGNYVIPNRQAIWIPANLRHSIATVTGAQLRSVHLVKGLINNFRKGIAVLKVNELLRAMINKASEFKYTSDMSIEQQRLLQVLADEINLSCEVELSLPLSQNKLILPILDWQQQNPHCSRSLVEWSQMLGASAKTISRRFNTELGMSFSQWQERMKLQHAIQWLGENRSVTEIALDLGYESLPAFIQMFKRNMGISPGKFTAIQP